MGALSATVGIAAQSIAPVNADAYPAFHEYHGANWTQEWLVIQMLGVALGAAGALVIHHTRVTPYPSETHSLQDQQTATVR